MTTHVDRNHIHNHFVWCAINVKTHNRYHSNKRSYHDIQKLSDDLCRVNGLSIIEVKSGRRGKGKYEYDALKQGNSYKEKLRIALDYAIANATSYDEFLQLMQTQGYEIKQGKYISFKHADGQRFTRAKTIGDAYSEENIKLRLQGKFKPTKEKASLEKLHDLSKNKFQKSVGLTHWAKIQNLKIMADTLILLREKGFDNLEEFDLEYANTNDAFSEISTAIKDTESKIKSLSEVLKQLRIYGRTKEMYTDFNKSRNKDKFIRETDNAESDVMLHETAKRYLNSYKKDNGNVPSTKEIKALLSQLQAEKSSQYEKYKTIKSKQWELSRLNTNLQQMIKREAVTAEQSVDSKRKNEVER